MPYWNGYWIEPSPSHTQMNLNIEWPVSVGGQLEHGVNNIIMNIDVFCFFSNQPKLDVDNYYKPT